MNGIKALTNVPEAINHHILIPATKYMLEATSKVKIPVPKSGCLIISKAGKSTIKKANRVCFTEITA